MRNSQRDLYQLIGLSALIVGASLLGAHPLITLALLVLMPVILAAWTRHRREEQRGIIRLSRPQRKQLAELDDPAAATRLAYWFPGAGAKAVKAALDKERHE
ncbi:MULTISPECIES: hypothetical protein [unclassified Corynebacterium]|uniref:hypothetical protein n=1 Tax=unclassified Corynebacterium TaxID=2624378 RepID=UPI001C47F073|nr:MULTISPECIES: hypothetical protein [unclassified Corynebacterium]MBV7281825.1 hypothetical protein [Corynebacterium sp. TAE3-ERU30]MBV7301461.1 hypothetical protein [Corynebacterium sp. TAE3-ERU2]